MKLFTTILLLLGALLGVISPVQAASDVGHTKPKPEIKANSENDRSDPIAAIMSSVDYSGKRDIVIAISAGHGGDDPGAIGVKRLQEKNVTLALSRATAKLINEIPGYKAVLIRDGDYYVGLRKQVELAHKENADLFIAIHADAAENREASGATVYALSQRGATSEQARMLADKENSADLIGGVGNVSFDGKDAVLASVLLDLSMTASVATSLEVGNELVKSLSAVTRLHRRNVEQAAFVVLKSADIPSLLVESGYITNETDAEALDSAKWRQQFAGALVNGITRWFYQRPPRGTLISFQQQEKTTRVISQSGKSSNADSQENASKPKIENGVKSKHVPVTYTVQRGDSLLALAARFHVTPAALQAANNMKKNSVQVGQVLKIPAVTKTEAAYKEHTIENGETLSQIAMSYEVSLERIRATNQLKSDNIQPGQVLKIPTS